MKEPPIRTSYRYCTASTTRGIYPNVEARYCSRLYGHPNGGRHRFGRHWREEPTRQETTTMARKPKTITAADGEAAVAQLDTAKAAPKQKRIVQRAATAAAKPARLEAPAGQKRCPGYTSEDKSYSQAEHLVPADREHFHANKGSKDGLWSQCKPCANAYQHDWLARKAKAAGKPAPQTRAAKQEARAKLAAVPTYADELAERIATAKPKVKGWTTEKVNGTIFALPTDKDTVGSPEGQAALEAVNAARAKNGTVAAEA